MHIVTNWLGYYNSLYYPLSVVLIVTNWLFYNNPLVSYAHCHQLALLLQQSLLPHVSSADCHQLATL